MSAPGLLIALNLAMGYSVGMTATPNLEQHYLESLSDEELDGLHDTAVQERLTIARQANIYKLEMDRRARVKATVDAK